MARSKLPKASDVLVLCACGCGETFAKRGSEVKRRRNHYKDLTHYGRALSAGKPESRFASVRQEKLDHRNPWRASGINIRKLLGT